MPTLTVEHEAAPPGLEAGVITPSYDAWTSTDEWETYEQAWRDALIGQPMRATRWAAETIAWHGLQDAPAPVVDAVAGYAYLRPQADLSAWATETLAWHGV